MEPDKKSKIDLNTPLQFVKGVGPRLSEIFKKRSLLTVHHFIHMLPRAYQDNRRLKSLHDIVPNQSVIVTGEVVKKDIIPLRGRHRKIYQIVLGEGDLLIPCKFFKLPYRNWFNNLRFGDQIEVHGKAIFYRNHLEFHHPQIFPSNSGENPKEEDLIFPVYTEIEQISQNKLRTIMKEIFRNLNGFEQDLEWLPEWLIKKYNLVSRFKALKGIHFPDKNKVDEYLQFKTEFQKRLIFDEFFELQFYFALKNKGWKIGNAPQIPIEQSLLLKVKNKLPFSLTLAQKRVLKTIFSGLSSDKPMHRLLQGDVGCGKTVVALISALACAKAGYQTAIMVPTEILAHQHYQKAYDFLEPFGVRVEKLTGKMKAGEKRTVTSVLKSGFCDVCIGTHALIQENVEFHNLAFVVVDEQHRFGSHQRALLKSKGRQPHFLVMTATPIPRTLSLTLYGDLDISIIDELPPRRQPIITKRVFASQRKKMFDFLKNEVQKGRQAYVIYPLVEESENFDLKNAIDQYEKLRSYYKDLRWGLLTGRMSPEEKQSVMSRFVSGKIQILVSTTVIEVGIDVPNANIMVIEHTERFGLSQLHQLRGRVGRGSYKSYCFLVLGDRFSKEASERAYIMQNSSDGFQIAEKDLEIRGPGEFLGNRQSGMPGFKIANLVRDARHLYRSKQAALDLISSDFELKKPEHQGIKNKFKELSESIRPG